MPLAETLLRRKPVIAAILASAVAHAAVLVGVPARVAEVDEAPREVYTAKLEPAALPPPAPIAVPAPMKRLTRPRLRPRLLAVPAHLENFTQPELLAETEQVAAASIALASPRPDIPAIDEPKPDVVALAQPAVPVTAVEPPRFPVQALPANISITYALTSPLADARAVYNWSREGDNYTITGEAEAIGFFTLFVEGRLRQESRGTVTAEGLRPERFVERKPNATPEGLEFDWAAHKVTFDRGDSRKTEELTGNTLDWLSMIFQMAHVPPTGESYDLRVFTQRRYYQFHLKVLGIEEIAIPLGTVRAMHLRHTDPEDRSEVDVWLGVDQHYLPVKLRYPVAKNRMTVEQSATQVSER